MAKVAATERGYFGGRIVEQGESFVVDDDLWQDERRRPGWAKLDPRRAFGGKGDHDGDGSVGGSKPKGGPSEPPAGPITIPADWQSRTAAERKALASEITGDKVPNAAEADKVIVAYVEANKPPAFGDAPAPETAEAARGNGVQAALGGTQPDWVDPGSGAPQQVD